MPQRILVVEDSEPMAEAIRRSLSGVDTVVEIVPDGLHAWDRISKDLGYFDLIVTDHHMPTLPGIELVQLLREAGFTGRIVVYSGALTPEIVAAYRAFAVVDILEKGASLRSLVDCVRRP